jgi:hypothetical protein
MDIKKLTQILIDFGVLIILGAIYWWACYYSRVTNVMGGNLGDFFQCLYTSSGPCSFIAVIGRLAGVPPYNPILFWIGIIMFGAGIILNFSLKKDGNP